MAASQPGVFNPQEFTDLGQPAFNGRLYTYVAGTTTHKTAYTDPAGLVPQTYVSDGMGGQYIALDARGELPAPLFLVSGAYDIALKRADGSTVWTRYAIGTEASGEAEQLALRYADPAPGLGSKLVAFMQRLVGSVARWTEDKLAETISIEDFGGVADGGVTDNSDALAKGCAAAIATGKPLRIPGKPLSYDFSTPAVVNYDSGNTQALRIVGDSGLLYYATNRSSKLRFTGTSGYAIQVNGRAASVGGTNQGSPMSVDVSRITFLGNGSCDGAIKITRGWYARIRRNNFFGFTKATGGVITFSADGVDGSNPISFAGTSDVEHNKFANSGRCVLLTGSTGGIVNAVHLTRNIALDQRYFLACDFGAGVPFAQNIIARGNHTEGTVVSDYYSQGAAGNWVIQDAYIEQNDLANNAPRIDIQGSSNYGIVVERNLISKELGAAGTALVRISNATSVLVRGNTANYGGQTDRYSVELQTCNSVEAEVMPTASSGIYYPLRLNGANLLHGHFTDDWRRVAAGGSGNFIGISSGNGFPGGGVNTTVNEYSRTNGRVTFSFKSTVTTKDSMGTQLLIGVLPLANFGNDVVFPVYCTNVTGTKPFWGVLPAGLTVATVYDATGAPVNYQTAISVGSVLQAELSYLNQA